MWNLSWRFCKMIFNLFYYLKMLIKHTLYDSLERCLFSIPLCEKDYKRRRWTNWRDLCVYSICLNLYVTFSLNICPTLLVTFPILIHINSIYYVLIFVIFSHAFYLSYPHPCHLLNEYIHLLLNPLKKQWSPLLHMDCLKARR